MQVLKPAIIYLGFLYPVLRSSKHKIPVPILSFLGGWWWGECAKRHMGSQFPDQESDLCIRHWEYGVLTTSLPGKPANSNFMVFRFHLHFSYIICFQVLVFLCPMSVSYLIVIQSKKSFGQIGESFRTTDKKVQNQQSKSSYFNALTPNRKQKKATQ